MTLVVARVFGSEIRIVSDTLLTPLPLHADIFYGALKCIAISLTCCVSYSGSPEIAEAAFGPIIAAPNGSRRDLVNHLLEQHRRSDTAADFLLAFADERPSLFRICDGDYTESTSTAWIGDPAGFQRFQELFNDQELAAGRAATTDDWTDWVGRLGDSMAGVIDDPGVPSVGGFVVTATSNPAERDGFRYLS